MNGKGSKIRKGADLNLFRQNYDNIFRKKESLSDSDRNEMLIAKDSMSHSEWEKINAASKATR